MFRIGDCIFTSLVVIYLGRVRRLQTTERDLSVAGVFTFVFAFDSAAVAISPLLKDGGGAPFLKDRYADVPVSREFVERGAWPLRDARDPVEEPISVLVFTMGSRVRTVLTNHHICCAHVDVM